MSQAKATVFRFVLRVTDHPMDVMQRFHPHGKQVLNRTEWRTKEPRSCAVTKLTGRPYLAGSPEPVVFDLEITYRPKGYITFVGGTKYDGWTAMMLDRARDGTLLDGNGKPLAPGLPPVYLPFEVYEDADFNLIDFGEFVGEFDVEKVKHVQYDEVLRDMRTAKHISMSVSSTFIAPRRQRPSVKIILSSAPSSTGFGGFGERIININNTTPHLRRVVLDHLSEVASGFIEGRYSIENISGDDWVFAELGRVLVDCTPNEQGQESRFGILSEYVSSSELEELALQLMATYQVEVSVVEGKELGLLLRRVEDKA